MKLKDIINESTKYDGKSQLKPDTIVGLGRYGQMKLKVVKDEGDSVSVINMMKNYKKDPYKVDKAQLKGAILS